MLPVLYTFRRCPYAMRARLALLVSSIEIELREVSLRNKPESMLAVSAKGSVPVLLLPDGTVVDESWDIMVWALRQHDPGNWLGVNEGHVAAAWSMVVENDTLFKALLDRYKYAERYPEYPQLHYRGQAEIFLQQLEKRLQVTSYLLDDAISIADVALFPFMRQFAQVDQNWFDQAPYPLLRRWLEKFLGSERFQAIMKKYPVWQPGDVPNILMNSTPA